MSTILKPLEHQIEAMDSLDKQFAENNNKALVILPSGSGKTHTVAFHVNKLKPKTFLYIVHRTEILTQTIEIFKEVCGLKAHQVGLVNQDSKEFDRPYVFASIQTLAIKENREKMPMHFEYLVIDEFHHVAADSYVNVITNYFKPKYFVGLTATPFRLDKKDILKYVDGNIAANVDVFEGIQRDILVPFHYIGLWDNIDYSQIEHEGHRYKISDLDKKLIIHKRDQAVLEDYRQRIEPENRLTIAFCNSVAHVHRIVKKFNDEGILSAGITYKEKRSERQQILQNFKKGMYKVLFTRDILNEGVDFPECNAIMFLRPTVSQTIFLQQLGRGLRKMSGKKDVKVLDYIGNYHRAFEKKGWLNVFRNMESDGELATKPFYEYHPSIKIEFDPKVIEMMDLQEQMFKLVSNKDIYEDYINCCEKEGKNFLTKSEYEASIHRKYSLQRLEYRYGSFKEFLYYHNLNPEGYGVQKSPTNFYNCTDEKKLIENYYKVKEQWKKDGGKNHEMAMRDCPPSNTFDNHKISDYGIINYKNKWGRYSLFLKYIGELKDDKNIGFLRTDNVEDKENKIKKAIKDLQKKLHKQSISYSEWRHEYGGFAASAMQQIGGWVEFKRKYRIV